MQDPTGQLCRSRLADYAKCIATVVDLNAELAFQQAQMFIKLTTKVGQPLVILRREGNIEGLWVIVQAISDSGLMKNGITSPVRGQRRCRDR